MTILTVVLSVAVVAACVAKRRDVWPVSLGAAWALLIADTSFGHALEHALTGVAAAFGLH